MRAMRRLLVAVPAALFLALLLFLPSSTSAQQRPQNGYVGPETCRACHVDQFERFSATTMGKLFLKHPRTAQEKLGCEGCHGPGKAHVDAGGGRGVGGLITFAKNDPTPAERRNAVCLQCHERTARLFWKGSPHQSRDVTCTSCHRVMVRVSEKAQLAKATEIDTCGQCHTQRRAQLMRFSHMPLLEGKMTCTSCHNPHGSVTEKLLKANSVNETCYSCHAEKRGPFLWEHPPVQENCLNCHDPHGSNHERMLKLAKPRLCQQCHVENRHPTRPWAASGGFNPKFISNRACANCHNGNIHGSNHPSGHAFTR